MAAMPTDDPRPGKRARPTEAAAEASASAPTTTRDDPAFAKYWDPKLHAEARRRLKGLGKVLARLHAKYPPPKDPKKRAKLHDHRYLYDKFGLPK
jgi:hypothetical protein